MIELKSQDRLRLLPRPAADKRLFTTNLNQGFKSFPKRKNNYLKYKLSEKNKVLDYLPIRMDIENVSRCNFHCTMCQVSDWPKYRRAEDMSFKDYKTLIDSQFGLIEIKLQGMGEPLLGKTYFVIFGYDQLQMPHCFILMKIINGLLIPIFVKFRFLLMVPLGNHMKLYAEAANLIGF